jgi:hypothetical protein
MYLTLREPMVCLPANSGIFICATLNLCIKIMIHIIYIYFSITSSSNKKKQKNFPLCSLFYIWTPGFMSNRRKTPGTFGCTNQNPAGTYNNDTAVQPISQHFRNFPKIFLFSSFYAYTCHSLWRINLIIDISGKIGSIWLSCLPRED